MVPQRWILPDIKLFAGRSAKVSGLFKTRYLWLPRLSGLSDFVGNFGSWTDKTDIYRT